MQPALQSIPCLDLFDTKPVRLSAYANIQILSIPEQEGIPNMIGLQQETVTTAPLYDVRESWNATYNRADRSLVEAGATISPGLAKRLAHYARGRLADIGWGAAIEACEVHVEGWSDYGGERPDEQNYTVRFTNPAGGSMGVQGILINKGWPVLDHGFFLDDE